MNCTALVVHDNWRICCHEAGHAIVAAKTDIIFYDVKIEEFDEAFVETTISPRNNPNRQWNTNRLTEFLQMYAGGAAAERKMFTTDVGYSSRGDRSQHGFICNKYFGGQNITFETSIAEALKYLSKESIEVVATELLYEKAVSYGRVCQLIGIAPKWER